MVDEFGGKLGKRMITLTVLGNIPILLCSFCSKTHFVLNHEPRFDYYNFSKL